MKQKITDIFPLSSQEVTLIKRLEWEGNRVFTRADIVSFCGKPEKANYLIKKLLFKKRLKAITKNIYYIVPIKAPGDNWGINEYLVCKALARGCKYYLAY